MVLAHDNVPLAFGLTLAAGSATMIGASVVFSPKLIKLISRHMLAISLGVSAGVMLYFSFVELLHFSVLSWMKAGYEENKAYQYATLCLFSGVFVMKIVDMIVHKLGGDDAPNRQDADEDIQITWNENENDGQCQVNAPSKKDNLTPHGVGLGNQDPVAELTHWYDLAENGTKAKKDQVEASTANHANESITLGDEEVGLESSDDSTDAHKVSTVKVITTKEDNVDDGQGLFRAPAQAQVSAGESKKRLLKMSLSTATAIAIHNFPDGLATFAAAVQDPAAGAVFAVAVAIHNVPEGLCVALPIYFATGSRKKAFFWASLATVSEIVAAIFAWVFLVNAVNHESWAILFGVVAGMLIFLSIKELIPTAHRYDPEDSRVTTAVIFGMGLMAIALVLLGFDAADQVLRRVRF